MPFDDDSRWNRSSDTESRGPRWTGSEKVRASSRREGFVAIRIRNAASSRASVPVLRRVSSREARLRALSAPRRAARRARRNVNRHPKTRRFGFGAANDVGAREGVAREGVAARRVTRADGYRRRTRVRTPPSPAARPRVVFRASLVSIARVCMKEGNTSCRLAPPIIRAGRMHLASLRGCLRCLVWWYSMMLFCCRVTDDPPARCMWRCFCFCFVPRRRARRRGENGLSPLRRPVPSANRIPPEKFPRVISRVVPEPALYNGVEATDSRHLSPLVPR